MRKAWNKLDLEGGGLQSLQIKLIKRQRKFTTALALWFVFPLGLHRHYLRQPMFWGYPLASLMAIGSLWAGSSLVAATVVVLMLGASIYDLIHILPWISQVNKEIRKELWLNHNAPAAPENYQGPYGNDQATNEAHLNHYIREKEREKPGHQKIGEQKERFVGPNKRMPSFAEQERLLREMAKKKKDQSDTR